MKSETKNVKINSSYTLLAAMKHMNDESVKLLIIVDNDDNYKGILSIGDIQRYFINHQTFDSPVSDAMRKNVKIATSNDSFEQVKAEMLNHRMEFMPVLDSNNKLVDVHFWDDVFGDQDIIQKDDLGLPVVIMAGGKGTRLRPITHIIPKPLIPVGRKPIIQVIVDKFVKKGCHDFFFSVNYKANMIKEYFDSLNYKEYNIEYFEEETPLGTAGSLSLLRNKINSTFFVSNCDIIIEDDYSQILKYHREHKNEMTAVAFVKEITIPYGTMEVGDDGCLTSLREKPNFTFLVNAGMYILESHLIDELPENEFFHITHLMQKIIDRNGRVGVFPINNGSWLDIGQWKEYQKTLRYFGEEIAL